MVVQREALVRADGRKADNVAVGTGTARHALAQLDQDARGVGIRIVYVERFVDLELIEARKPVGRIFDQCGGSIGLSFRGNEGRAATAAVAAPAPLRNCRRPTSTRLSHLFILLLSPDFDGSKWTLTPLQEPGQPENAREISEYPKNGLMKSRLMFGKPNMLQCR